MVENDNGNADYQQEDKPFNDVIDHFNKIEGMHVGKRAKMSQLPKGIRLIGYFLFGSLFLILVVGMLVSWFR